MPPLRTLLRTSSLVAIALAAPPVLAQPQGTIGQYSDATVTGSVLEPRPIDVPDDAELAGMITVPEGFSVQVVARELGNSRMIAVHPERGVYITRRTNGDVIHLDDADGDGRFEGFTRVASRPGMHGIAFDGDTVYLATVNEVFTAPVNADGGFGDLVRIIDDLPDGGQHPNRTLAIGPDDMLYISAGSTCNACAETNPESATMLRASKDGTSRTIFATGLRNTIGFGWEPQTGVLYGADHGIDWLGDEEQQEEINKIEQGKQFGWPYVYDFSKLNPQDNPPEGITLEQWAERSEEPVLGYTAHSAPMQMAFYTGGAFPEAYQGDAFIAMRGSWNRRPPSGYEVIRVDFENGEPKAIEPFATGFLVENTDGFGFLGRLTGIAQDTDGSLLVVDDVQGILYRISHDETAEAGAAEATNPPNTVPAPATSEIAFDLVETDGALEVTAGFADGEMLSLDNSAEGHNASPMLDWAEGPEGTQSYVVIADDPDAAAPKPFVHWVGFDIPADTTMLREGLPTEPSLTDPKGMKQGTNSRGSTGYFGPRPPLGDPAHHYHFQVFALDIAQLPVDPGATRDQVLAAIEGHVLAKGQIVGLYERPEPKEPVK